MKRGKQITILLIICTLLVVPFISAGFSDWFKGVTGKATTKPVNINISVTGGSAPIITIVDNISMTDLSSSGTTEGPSATIVNINFTAYDANGFGNINDSAAIINFTNGSTVRTNSSCVNYADFSTDYVNYTCTVTMWWWDGTGSWDIQATISDLNGNTGTNTSTKFYIGATTGFIGSPTNLAWTNINPGATNSEASDHMILNNTGNLVRNIDINTTNLLGETNPFEALWANNFTVKNAAGCGGTAMVDHVFTNVPTLTLSIGNYTIADGTAQETAYFCLEQAGPELDQQAYSTSAEGAWTLKIVV